MCQFNPDSPQCTACARYADCFDEAFGYFLEPTDWTNINESAPLKVIADRKYYSRHPFRDRRRFSHA